ncbi:ComF family protein [Clostridium aestuarii]|uniref:ComF family protein n=1 Tax=Clostridium aestuarii TaxID=338193 RepID=A0ABT4D329_9CLOT|nr:ComF family protein [Clostridium aestuarii]MCY6485642.1 ComF family protein [Clostridium aestuarii]
MGNGIIKSLKYLVKCINEVIYSDARECIICNGYIKEEELLCGKCSASVKICNNSLEIINDGIKIVCYSSAYYSSIIKELIIRLKYKNDFKAGEVLAKYMINTIKLQEIKFDVITYVPSTREAIKKRGYNQSEYLAKIIGNEMNKKVYRILKKTKNTKDQIGLNEEERWLNLKNSFRSIRYMQIESKTVLLIDDVVTTGATSFYCAKNLLENGAKEVLVLTAARSNI